MTYKTNNDILRVRYGKDYDILLRARNHRPDERDFRIRRIILDTKNIIRKGIDFLSLKPPKSRLNITRFGPITLATK